MINAENQYNPKVTRYVNYKRKSSSKFFLQHIKVSNPREIENLKGIKSLETVIERHEKVIEKLEIKRINKIKELKELETTKKGLEELEKEKTNETTVNVPKEMLFKEIF